MSFAARRPALRAAPFAEGDGVGIAVVGFLRRDPAYRFRDDADGEKVQVAQLVSA